MNHEKKLGRGLDFLLSETARETENEEMIQAPVEKIRPNRFQPRLTFSEGDLGELASSIKSHGVLQPLIARRTDDGFELVAGERRLRASKLAGLESVPVIIREANDDQLLIIAMAENLQREDLNPIEKGKACAQFLEMTQNTQDEAASKLGMSRPSLANHIRLLDLPTEIQEFVSRGTISMGHARAILSVKDETTQLTLASDCITNDWSVRQTEEQAKTRTQPTPIPKDRPKAKNLPAWHRELEERLCQALTNKVSVKFKGETAMITIETPNRENFDHLFDKLICLPELDTAHNHDDALGNLLM